MKDSVKMTGERFVVVWIAQYRGAIIVGSHEGVGSDGMKSGGIQWVVQERQAASCDLHGGTKSGLDTTVENI